MLSQPLTTVSVCIGICKDSQTVCDDKSGYDYVPLTPSSRTLLGLPWKNCNFTYTTLPFG